MGPHDSLIGHLSRNQPWHEIAPVLLFFTLVSERSLWKYPFDHTLRDLYFDMGHAAQTVIMVTEFLGLGSVAHSSPRESDLEQLLGLDGLTETLVYQLSLGHPAPSLTEYPYRRPAT